MKWFQFVILATLSGTATAAEIRDVGVVEDGWSALQKISVSGKISAGDAAKIDGMVAEDDNAIVFLNSTGGDYREGLAMAKLFQSRKIRTTISSNTTCLSACAIAFLGGSAMGEEGTEPFARSISANAKLGFHAPFLSLGDAIPKAEIVEAAYDHAIKTVTDFVRAAESLGITPDVAADMMTPQRSDLYMVKTVRDLLRVGVEVHGALPATVMTRTMVKNLCLNGWVGRIGDWSNAERELSKVKNDLEWPEISTMEIRTGYFSADVVDARRTAIPVAEAGEGSGWYVCIVDHANVAGRLAATNRGFILVEHSEDIMTAAKSLDPGPTDYGRVDVESQFSIGVVDPLDRSVFDQELRFAVVPNYTEIRDVQNAIDRYIRSEPAL